MGMCWSSCGRFVAIGARDNTCRIYSIDPLDGWSPAVLTGHKDAVVCAFFGDTVGQVYTVSRDGGFYCWENAAVNDDGVPTGAWALKSRHFFQQSKVVSADFHPKTKILSELQAWRPAG